MRNLILSGFYFLFIASASAQIKAVTETGDEVVLHGNGTWNYVDNENASSPEVEVNEELFEKEEKAQFLVKSKKLSIGVWINPKEWSFNKGEQGVAYEYQFQKKGEDIFGMMITEKIEIPIETLKEIAVENARAAAPDIKVTKEEYRMVNGVKVYMMQMAGTIQGAKFTYFGYYYSDEGGTVQLLTYTGTNLFNEYQSDMEAFLNGFVKL